MELYLLDNNFNTVDIIDEFTSMVWEEKFHSIGSFTLIFPRKYAARVRNAAYIRTSFDGDCCKCGRIERLFIEDDAECKVTGHLLEVLLHDRILAKKGSASGSVTTCIIDTVTDILSDCGIGIASLQPQIQASASITYCYNNLAEWLYKTLKPYGASFRVTLDADSDEPLFSIILGKDRTESSDSGEQPAIFSSSFGNIVSLEYEENSAEIKNFLYVEGGDGTVVTVDRSANGKRREIYSLADDILPEDYETADAYTAALHTRGIETLSKCADGRRISVECDSDALPRYGSDYALGDLCDVCDEELGLSFEIRITSVDTVWENGRKTVFPSFGDEIRSIRSLLGSR